MPKLLPILFALSALTATPSALAQTGPPCAPADHIADQLTERYDEAPVAIGLQASGILIQVYATTNGETWTLVATNAAGISCILAAGTNWQPLTRGQGA